MKTIQVSYENWKKINGLKKRHHLTHHNEVITQLLIAVETYCKEEPTQEIKPNASQE